MPACTAKAGLLAQWQSNGLLSHGFWVRVPAPDSVTLAAGDVVTCTLQNTKRGAVVVVKQAEGGDNIFQFSSQTLNPAIFSLTTVSGTAQQSFTNLVPGAYDVTETVPAGWDLVSECTNRANPASITVAPGLTVTALSPTPGAAA